MYTAQRQVFLIKNLLLFGTTAVRGGSAPPARLQIDGTDARSAQKTPAGTPQNVRPVHSVATSLALCLNSLLIYFPAIRGGSAPPARLEIDGTDTRHEHKLTAGVSLIR